MLSPKGDNMKHTPVPWAAKQIIKSDPHTNGLFAEALSLLKQCYDKLECYDSSAHAKGACLDQRIKKFLENVEKL